VNTKRVQKTHSSAAVIAVLAAAATSSSLAQTIVIPLQGRFPELLHASPAEAAWIVTVTMLSAAISTPISGRLGDLYGKRRVLVGLLAAMLAGSIITASSSSLIIVIAGRTLQGLASGIVPVAISVLRDYLPPYKLPGAIALVSAALGIGGSLGLPLSGIVSQHMDWHLLFVITATLAALNILGIMLVLPVGHIRTR
jgi:predicted MFS family arabinose efflux permease